MMQRCNNLTNDVRRGLNTRSAIKFDIQRWMLDAGCLPRHRSLRRPLAGSMFI
jgi:hypothetical protein